MSAVDGGTALGRRRDDCLHDKEDADDDEGEKGTTTADEAICAQTRSACELIVGACPRGSLVPLSCVIVTLVVSCRDSDA